MIHNQIEGHEMLIGDHFKGSVSELRYSRRIAKAAEAVISKEMSLTHAAFRFGVDKDKLSMILNLK